MSDQADYSRLRQQALTIEQTLRHAGISSMPLDSGVRELVEELTDWMLVADGVKHDPRCPNNAATGGDNAYPCLRCEVEQLRAALASLKAAPTSAEIDPLLAGAGTMSPKEWDAASKQAKQLQELIVAPLAEPPSETRWTAENVMNVAEGIKWNGLKWDSNGTLSLRAFEMLRAYASLLAHAERQTEK